MSRKEPPIQNIPLRTREGRLFREAISRPIYTGKIDYADLEARLVREAEAEEEAIDIELELQNEISEERERKNDLSLYELDTAFAPDIERRRAERRTRREGQAIEGVKVTFSALDEAAELTARGSDPASGDPNT